MPCVNKLVTGPYGASACQTSHCTPRSSPDAPARAVQYLRNPQRFSALGARASKGILLEGEPGTGAFALASCCSYSRLARHLPGVQRQALSASCSGAQSAGGPSSGSTWWLHLPALAEPATAVPTSRSSCRQPSIHGQQASKQRWLALHLRFSVATCPRAPDWLPAHLQGTYQLTDAQARR